MDFGTMMSIIRAYIFILISGGTCLFTFSRSAAPSDCHAGYYHWPQCTDHPDGYACRCGPGYLWNGRMCVAIGLDSRLEFSSLSPPRYATVLPKPFPALTSFSVTAWVRVAPLQSAGTLLSYSDGIHGNILLIRVDSNLTLTVWNTTVSIEAHLRYLQWHHLAWSVNYKKNQWQVLINGGRIKASGRFTDTPAPIPAGGELLLGQAARLADLSFEWSRAFLGHVAFVNIWARALGRGELREVYRACPLVSCGTAVQWADFRSGTRGDLRLHWPSGIVSKSSCFEHEHETETCERFCSQEFGARCKEGYAGNVLWPRTDSGNITLPCRSHTVNASRTSTRVCLATEADSAQWQSPDVTNCTSREILKLVIQEEKATRRDTKGSYLAALNKTIRSLSFASPVDLHFILKLLNAQIDKQNETVALSKTQRLSNHIVPTQELPLGEPILTWNDTKTFAQKMSAVLDTLLAERHRQAWLYAQPRGAEGDHFLRTVTRFLQVLCYSLHYHVHFHDIGIRDAFLSAKLQKIAYVIRLYTSVSNNGFYQERVIKSKMHPKSFIKVHLQPYQYATAPTNSQEFIVVSTFICTTPFMVANHDILGRSKEDNINSVIAGVHIFTDDIAMYNQTDLIEMTFEYLEDFNISNSNCVVLKHGSEFQQLKWERGTKCNVTAHTGASMSCGCTAPGWFAVTSNMFDNNWRASVKLTRLLEAPSYVGCTVSATLCLLSVLLLSLFRASSMTAHLHKHFGVAIVLAQLVFMVGIERTKHQVICQIFALLFHYLFLCTFLWLLNETFNLYMVIIYAAHSLQLDNQTSPWRFYILGWGLPLVIVAAMVGVYRDDYFALDKCWIAWEHIWLFAGPALGIISVIMLVLIFTAKEHSESSYSKNEQTNTMIIIYSRALWTQVILLSICWSFAVLSMTMRGTIIKWIYALFNIIHGLFFFVFFFLLNDEVRAVFKLNQQHVLNPSDTGDHHSYTAIASSDEDGENIRLVDMVHRNRLLRSTSHYSSLLTENSGELGSTSRNSSSIQASSL